MATFKKDIVARLRTLVSQTRCTSDFSNSRHRVTVKKRSSEISSLSLSRRNVLHAAVGSILRKSCLLNNTVSRSLSCCFSTLCHLLIGPTVPSRTFSVMRSKQHEVERDQALKEVAIGVEERAFAVRNDSRGIQYHNGIETVDRQWVGVEEVVVRLDLGLWTFAPLCDFCNFWSFPTSLVTPITNRCANTHCFVSLVASFVWLLTLIRWPQHLSLSLSFYLARKSPFKRCHGIEILILIQFKTGRKDISVNVVFLNDGQVLK